MRDAHLKPLLKGLVSNLCLGGVNMRWTYRGTGLSLLLMLAALGCRARDELASSGATNWLRCRTNSECRGHGGASCAEDGFCENQDGSRITESSAVAEPSSMSHHSESTAGPSSADSALDGNTAQTETAHTTEYTSSALDSSAGDVDPTSAPEPATTVQSGAPDDATETASLVEPSCGDGTQQETEECDDGNTFGQDGCSETCLVEPGFVCTGERSACNRSCAVLSGTECQGDDCCSSLVVPGGRFTYKENTITLPPYRLDKYEVTVARFRAYLNAVDAWGAEGNPAPGAGAFLGVPDSGWRADWDPSAVAVLSVVDDLKPLWPVGAIYTWGDAVYPVPGADSLAVNRVPWHVALAFCIWDGGRLPAAAEWAFAAQGGEEQTTFPWGNVPTAEEMFANLPPPIAVPPYNEDPFWSYIGVEVGSHSESVGRFGHMDMGAGLSEWTRDSADAPSDTVLNLSGDASLEQGRVISLASWERPSATGMALTVGSYQHGIVGLRCARNP